MDRDIKYQAFVKKDAEENCGRLVNSCDELDYLLAHPDANNIFSQHYLNDILTYATSFSEYYKKYKGFKSLQDFPIVTKEVLKENWEKIAISPYANDDTICTKYTSGSTGTPFKMIMDRYKHSRWIAGNKVFRNNVGVKSHEKTVFISETVADKSIPMSRQDEDNVYYLDFRYLESEDLNNLIDYLIDNNVKSLTALASIYDKIAIAISNNEIKPWKGSLIAVFSVSETLKEHTRKIISEYFNCPMYVLYANEENGVLGVEDGSGLGCRANNADFYFEILSMEDDVPVKEGEVGRLIITDFFNKAFPMIRYENGDLVSVKRTSEGKLYITEILGRKTDMLYTTDGRMVHYFNSISFLEPFMDIKQFQLIQHDYHHFTWVLNTENHSYEEMIVSECKKLFGEDSEWDFKYVNEIPKLRSGKHRMTVCNIADKKVL